MNVTLRQIRSFLAVARCGSFTRAAELLHLSQPALTVHIRQLEQELDLKLFDRSTHHVKLTPAGMSFMPMMQNALGGFEHAIASISQMASQQDEIIRLGCFPSFAAAVLPTAIRKFREQHAKVSFLVFDTSARNVVAMVRSEEIDCGICHHDSAADLLCRPLLREPMHVVFPEGHPIGQAQEVRIEDVIKNPLVLLDGESDSRTRIDAAISGAGYLVFPAAEAAHMSTALALVQSGLGITILPLMAFNGDAVPDLRSRPIAGIPLIRPIGIATKRNHVVSPQTRAFIDVLAEVSEGYGKRLSEGIAG